MKKSTRSLLRMALFFVVVGAAFCVAGLCLGFRPSQLSAMEQSGEFRWIGPSGWRENAREVIREATTDEVDYDQTFTGVKKLKLDCALTDCLLIPSEGTQWRVRGENLPSGFTAKQSGSTLSVKCGRAVWKFWDRNQSSYLEIYIPKDQVVETLDLDLGVGSLSTGEGYVICRELKLDGGVGSCEMSVDIRKKLELDSGVGDVELEVIGREEDFDYDVDCGVASVEIGEYFFDGLGGDHKIDNKASKEMEIDSGVGSVHIWFTDEK